LKFHVVYYIQKKGRRFLQNSNYLAIILGLLYSMVGVTLKVLSYNIGVIFLYALMLISILVIVATVQKMRKGEQ